MWRTRGTTTEAGFYAWRKRPPSERAIRHAWLTDLIAKAHVDSRGTYGARRVHAELTIGHGIVVGHSAVEMLMRRIAQPAVAQTPIAVPFGLVPGVTVGPPSGEREAARRQGAAAVVAQRGAGSENNQQRRNA